MTEIKVVREDEKATAILRAIRQIDEGAELVPVVHGRWVSEYEYDFMAGHDVRTGFSCDRCGCYYKKRSDFCPNCGADMRGAKDGKQ